MGRWVVVVMLPLLLLATGCASIASGTSQAVKFNSNPQGADCTLVREGETIGSFVTPSEVEVKKSKHEIDITCVKEGYQEASNTITSDTEGWTLGNILLGGVIGWGIDSATGADNKYDEAVTVTLVPEQATTDSPPVAATMPPPVPGTGDFAVMLAGYPTASRARESWDAYVDAYPGLSTASRRVQLTDGPGGEALYRLYGTGLAEGDANSICDQIRQRGDDCEPIQF